MVECQKQNNQSLRIILKIQHNETKIQRTRAKKQNMKFDTLERCSVSAPLVITVTSIGIPMMSQ